MNPKRNSEQHGYRKTEIWLTYILYFESTTTKLLIIFWEKLKEFFPKVSFLEANVTSIHYKAYFTWTIFFFSFKVNILLIMSFAIIAVKYLVNFFNMFLLNFFCCLDLHPFLINFWLKNFTQFYTRVLCESQCIIQTFLEQYIFVGSIFM